MRELRALAGAGAALALVASLSGCSTALGRQAESGSQTNFIQGDGTYTWIAPSKRGAPIELSGKTADGSRADVAAWRGRVVVINVWYAGCGPCRAEAPSLAEVATASASSVQFLGINTKDDASAVTAFDRRYAVPYPSVLDVGDGAAVLALRGKLSVISTPTTVVLDRRGRPAARILGPTTPDVLTWLIEDVQAGTLTPRPHTSQAAAAS